MMSVWSRAESGWEKVKMSAANGRAKGSWPENARALTAMLNEKLISPLQHGAQDDFESHKNPNVSERDTFTAFVNGKAVHLIDYKACARFYEEQGIWWPYDKDGKYRGPTHP
jgi:hypothetical protein